MDVLKGLQEILVDDARKSFDYDAEDEPGVESELDRFQDLITRIRSCTKLAELVELAEEEEYEREDILEMITELVDEVEEITITLTSRQWIALQGCADDVLGKWENHIPDPDLPDEKPTSDWTEWLQFVYSANEELKKILQTN